MTQVRLHIDLGKDEKGQRRREALGRQAAAAGFMHGGQSCIGRLICTQADAQIKAQKHLRSRLPIIEIVDARVIKRDDLNVSYVNDTVIKLGYQTLVTLQYDNRQIEVEAIGALVVRNQTFLDCQEICENKRDELLKMKSGTPGEIRRAVPGLDGIKALSCFDISIPPTQRHATQADQIEFHERTGKGYIYLQNEIYAEWAKEYNRWIIDNPDLAMDYRCQMQNEDWVPVQ